MIKYSIIVPIYKHTPNHFFEIFKNSDNIELILVLIENKNKYRINNSNIKNIYSHNNGYAYAVNKGAQYAIGEYLIIVNDDIVFDKEFFTRLNSINKDIIIPFVYNYYSKKIESIGSKINYCLYNRLNTQFKNFKKLHLTGSIFIIKKDIYEKNKMDERFFMYYEDIDLSIRLKKKYELFFSDELKVFHKHSYSKFNLKRYFLQRNRILFLIKNYKRKIFLILLYLLCTEFFIMYFQSIKQKSINPIFARIDSMKKIREFYKYENTC